MPVTAIRRRIVNPARRKRNASSPKRKLTTAQVLAGFGGKPAQARALAAAGRATKSPVRKKRAKSRKNPDRALRVALRNSSPPQTKGEKTVQRKRSTSTRRRTAAKRRNPAPRARAARSPRTRTVTKYRYRTRRSNPVSRRRTRRRANPRQIQALSMLRKAAMVSAGAIGTRLSVQAALGAKNTGATGIFANLVASLVLGALVSSITKKSEDGHMVTIGGFAGTLLRMAQDNTPLGKQASLSGGVGDLGVAGLGKYGPGLWMHPTQTEGGRVGPTVVPQQLRPVPAPAPAQSNGNGMAGYSRNQRFAARY